MAIKWTRKWENDRKKLKEEYFEKGIVNCEAQLPGCFVDNFLSFHHRHKRIWYHTRGREDKLGDFNQTILVCNNCHNRLENDRKKTEEVFKELRGIDISPKIT
jgi:hypothetical protein